jgi:hypothetical protein
MKSLNNDPNKKEFILKEIELIHGNIKKFDDYSFITKGWTISLWSALILLILQEIYYNSLLELMIYLPIVIIFPFWILDALLKYFQRFSVARSEIIGDYLNNNENSDNFVMYDPVSRLSRNDERFKDYFEKVQFWKCFLVRLVSFIYHVLIIINLIISLFFVKDGFWVLSLCLFPFFVISAGLWWYYSNKGII